MANDETPQPPNWSEHQPAGGSWPPPPPPPPGPWGHWPGNQGYQHGWGGYGYPYDPNGLGRPSGRRRKGAAALLAAGALLIGGAGVAVGVGIGSAGGNPSATAPPSGSSGGLASPSTGTSGGSVSTSGGSPSNVASIARKVDPALVDINTQLQYQREEAAGTGMVLTSNGEVLTNNHVIEGATVIDVTDIGNGRTYRARVVGYDRTDDVAILQMEHASGLATIRIGNSDAVRRGQGIVGIGNAGGVGGAPSVAGGSVTGIGQSIKALDQGNGTSEILHGLIRTNADIRPGDSGGPLVNANGRVVGMDTAASSNGTFTFQTPSTSGTEGFAIPINHALQLAKQIERGQASGSVHIGATPFLGVEVTTPSALYQGTSGGGFGGLGGFGFFGNSGASGSGSSSTPPVSSGAAIASVFPGTSAAQAGLGTGDIIVAIDGHPVSSPAGLTKDLLGRHPGQRVSLAYVTPGGQHRTAQFTLQAGPPQ